MRTFAPRARHDLGRRLILNPVAAHLDVRWKKFAPPDWLECWAPEPFALAGGSTEIVTMGSGPTLVLLPPLPGYKEAWLACAAPLARTRRIVTFDLRTRFEGPPRWEALLEDLERVLDAHAPGAVAIAGHSLGGALAQRWALARPDRVRALVLSSTFARVTNPPGNRWARFVEQPLVVSGQRLLPRSWALPLARRLATRGAWVYDPKCDERVLDFVRFCIRDASLPMLRGTLSLAMAHDTRSALTSLAAPALVVVGERESPFALAAADELRRLVPGAAYAVSPGASHLHPLSSPEWLTGTIAEWLAVQDS